MGRFVLFTFISWGYVLLSLYWRKLHPTRAVFEGFRSPSTRNLCGWNELYSSPVASSSTKVGAKPRTWPQDYETLTNKNITTAYFSAVPWSTKVSSARALPTYRRYRSCEPKSEWHTYSFPTCNSIHEIDMEAGVTSASSDEVESAVNKSPGTPHVEHMFGGATRETWLVHRTCTDGHRCADTDASASGGNHGQRVILKTLRWHKEYDEVVYYHQRIDALALERLTASPHVIDIYGYCGVTALNEFADGGVFRKMFMQNHQNISDEQRLVYAKDAALALADIHEIDGPGNMTSMVHHDFSVKNFLAVNGKLKISDFNDGQLLRWDLVNNRSCSGFDWDSRCGTQTERTNRRAPEECMEVKHRRRTTEKVEVYHLGVVFFLLLTGEEWPYYFERSSSGKVHKPQSVKVKKLILAGKLPDLPLEVEQSNSTIIKKIARAMEKAFTFNPKKRPSARVIADYLIAASKREEARAVRASSA